MITTMIIIDFIIMLIISTFHFLILGESGFARRFFPMQFHQIQVIYINSLLDKVLLNGYCVCMIRI